MSYQLPPDISAKVDAQLATGEYDSVDAVLRDAIVGLERRQKSLAELRALVQVAEDDIAAGRVGYFNITATMEAIDRRLNRTGNARE